MTNLEKLKSKIADMSAKDAVDDLYFYILKKACRDYCKAETDRRELRKCSAFRCLMCMEEWLNSESKEN